MADVEDLPRDPGVDEAARSPWDTIFLVLWIVLLAVVTFPIWGWVVVLAALGGMGR